MNIPNLLSVFRLILVPVFIMLFITNRSAAVAVFAAACATDILDGFIARKFKLITRLGTILDPIADKLMQLSVLGCLYFYGLFPGWGLGILLIKEFIMFLGTASLLKKGILMPANIFGKTATVIISACIITILVFSESVRAYTVGLALVASCAAVIALISYIIMFNKKIRNC